MKTIRTHQRPEPNAVQATGFYINEACPVCKKPLASDGTFVYCTGKERDGGGCPYFRNLNDHESQCSG